MAGEAGIGPAMQESKSCALTAWRFPYMVADSGLEPERITAPHFKGGVSANSTNQPWCGIGYSKPYALRHPNLNRMCLPIPHMKSRRKIRRQKVGASSSSVSFTPFPASRTDCFDFAIGSSKDLSPVSFTSSGERGLNSYATRRPRTSASSLYQRRIYNFDSLTDCPEAFQLPVTSLCGHTSSQCSFFIRRER